MAYVKARMASGQNLRVSVVNPSMRIMTSVPVIVDCPPAMEQAVRYVLAGEYESHHDGKGLSILDIGANVGSFALWADLRWPGSTINCYEPNPGTFAYLKRNTAGHTSITAHNAALFPGARAREPFFSRFDGDGEAGLASYATDTFRTEIVKPAFEVDVLHPAHIRSADIVKLDIEGGEADVLAHLDLSQTSLVLAEFQNRKNRTAMQSTLAAADFEMTVDDACPWDPILDYMDYSRELKGDIYGRMFYRRRGMTRLTYQPS
jgi:FkbM family methyltransferase